MDMRRSKIWQCLGAAEPQPKRCPPYAVMGWGSKGQRGQLVFTLALTCVLSPGERSLWSRVPWFVCPSPTSVAVMPKGRTSTGDDQNLRRKQRCQEIAL